MKFASKICGSEMPPLIFLSTGTDQTWPSKFYANAVTSKFLNPSDTDQVRRLEVNEAQRLRQLEDDNGRLKKIVAQQALDIDVLKVVLSVTFNLPTRVG